MDMKKIALFMMVAFALFSCVKPDERVRDASTELRSLKAFVYYDESNLSKYEEVDLLSGMYIEEKGLASYTFPDDAEKFNESSLKKCRVEASLPSAARLVLTDENGNEKSCGLEGWHNLYNTSLYFNIVADNGDTKNFKIQTRCQN